MIVPSAKMMFCTAVVLVPFAFLAAAVPGAAAVSWLFIGGLLLVALVDAIVARKNLDGIGVEVPVVTRMSKDRDAKLNLRIQNTGKRTRTVRVGLAWPREIQTPVETLTALLPAEVEWSNLPWSCVPLKRGNFKFDLAYLEIASPLGLWAARKKVPVKTEIRVYPNVLKERNLMG